MTEIINNSQHLVKVFRSGHSVDVIAKTTSKRAVLQQVRMLTNADAHEVLCIGDKGRWPGNDSELLAEFPSLSVDEVSTDGETCWNLAPAGFVGPDALASYFSAIKSGRRCIALNLTELRSSRP